jgi:hypothetical protein
MPPAADDPRTILEEKESPEDPTHEEISFVLGRLIAWLLGAEAGPKLPGKVGKRALVLCYKLRPDLLEGITLRQIAKVCRTSLSDAHNLSKDLSDVFSIRGLHDRGNKLSTERYKRARARQGRGKVRLMTCSHLHVINGFARWRSKRGQLTPADAARIHRDFEPVRRFLQQITPP